MSANCKAYQKPSCWLPRHPGSDLCATCASAKNRDDFRLFLLAIPNLPEEDILAFTNFKKTLGEATYAPLDDFLAAVYRRSKTLMKKVIQQIRSTSLHPTLLLRIRNHTRTHLCSTYGWMLREGLFDDMILPQKCLTCLAHTVLYGGDEKKRILQRMLAFQTEFPGVLRATHEMLEGRVRILQFQQALVDRDYPPRLIDSFIQMSSVPLIQLPRLMPWKEELIAKSWHPSRMQHWCLDLEEQALWGEDFPEAPPLCGAIVGKAEWHIRWD
jgi:hypothetical protein